MPLELGLFLGCKYFGGRHHGRKSCLVLDGHPYRYRKFISDLAGQDVHSYGYDLLQLITQVRDWLRIGSRQLTIPGGRKLYDRYREFQRDLPRICRQMEISRRELTFVDFSFVVKHWLKANRMRMIELD